MYGLSWTSVLLADTAHLSQSHWRIPPCSPYLNDQTNSPGTRVRPLTSLECLSQHQVADVPVQLLNSTGNSAQCYVAAWMGGESGGEWIHVYVWLSPFPVHLKLSQYPCLENPMDRGAWWATVHGVANSRTRLRG